MDPSSRVPDLPVAVVWHSPVGSARPETMTAISTRSSGVPIRAPSASRPLRRAVRSRLPPVDRRSTAAARRYLRPARANGRRTPAPAQTRAPETGGRGENPVDHRRVPIGGARPAVTGTLDAFAALLTDEGRPCWPSCATTTRPRNWPPRPGCAATTPPSWSRRRSARPGCGSGRRRSSAPRTRTGCTSRRTGSSRRPAPRVAAHRAERLPGAGRRGRRRPVLRDRRRRDRAGPRRASRVLAVDRDPLTCAVARANAEALGLARPDRGARARTSRRSTPPAYDARVRRPGPARRARPDLRPGGVLAAAVLGGRAARAAPPRRAEGRARHPARGGARATPRPSGSRTAAT